MILNELELRKVEELLHSEPEEIDVIVKDDQGNKSIETKTITGIDKAKDILKIYGDLIPTIIKEVLDYIEANKLSKARNTFWDKVDLKYVLETINLLALMTPKEHAVLTENDAVMPYIHLQWSKLKTGSEKKKVKTVIDGVEKEEDQDVDIFSYSWTVSQGFGNVVAEKKPKSQTQSTNGASEESKTRAPSKPHPDGFKNWTEALKSESDYYKSISTDGAITDSAFRAFRKGVTDGKIAIDKYKIAGKPLTMEDLKD